MTRIFLIIAFSLFGCAPSISQPASRGPSVETLRAAAAESRQVEVWLGSKHPRGPKSPDDLMKLDGPSIVLNCGNYCEEQTPPLERFISGAVRVHEGCEGVTFYTRLRFLGDKGRPLWDLSVSNLEPVVFVLDDVCYISSHSFDIQRSALSDLIQID